MPPSYKDPYDVREVIARLVDGSDFLEFKGLYDQQTICGWAEIEGEPVAFIGNNGPITTKGSVKAAQFIQLCCQQGTPIIYLQNTTGYMVGTEAERGGIVKHGSKMIQAVANATVPQITIVIGGSFGAGNYGMCGRAYDPRFIFAWPNSRTAVMGGEQAAGVMKTVTEQKFLREGKEPPREQIDKMFKGIVDQFDRRSTALYGTRASVGRRHHRSARHAPHPGLHPLDRPRDRWCGRSIPSPSASQGCRHEVHARARGAAPDLEDADRPRDQSATSTSGRRKAPFPPTSCSRRWATPACWASTSRCSSAARASISPTPWSARNRSGW